MYNSIEKTLDGGRALVKTDRADEETKWITVNGTHVPLDQNGTARAGGKLKGKNFVKAKFAESQNNRI